MKAIVVENIGDFVIKDIQIPELKDNEALIKVAITGLCRTDLKIIRHGHRDLTLPRVPGEEVVGTVIDQKGRNSSLIGKRVYIYPGTSCHKCDSCNIGAENLCRGMTIMGFHRDGGFAEYVIAPTDCLLEIPNDLSDEEALFAEPLSCCLNALELAQVKSSDKIGIWGAGPAGSLLYRASNALKAIPQIIEPDLSRRARFVDALPSSPNTMCYDVAVVAVGNQDAYQQALCCLKPRGRLIVFSGLLPEYSLQKIDLNRLHYLEQTITGAYGCSMRHSIEAIRMIKDRAIIVSDLISHRMSLWDLKEALQKVENRQCLKIHLYPNK